MALSALHARATRLRESVIARLLLTLVLALGAVGTFQYFVVGGRVEDDLIREHAAVHAADTRALEQRAEAAYKLGDKVTALAAYTNGISAHIDFVNARNQDDNQPVLQISAAEKANFLAAPQIVPTNPDSLTLTQIMSQKYIAEWGWGHNELWMDMRRYHYTDKDPVTGAQIYPGFAPPPPNVLDTRNGGKVAQRIRPRYNSEYVWNSDALGVIGGLSDDYHTKPLWITEPGT